MACSRTAIALLLALANCQSPRFPHTDKRYCRKHHIVLVTVKTFTPAETVGIEYGDERVRECEEKSPNCLPAALVFHRTKVYNLPFVYAYCPTCEAEFQKCSAPFRHQ
jgi:hypothetical protein